MGLLGHFRDQLLHDDIHHGAGGEAQQIGEHAGDQGGGGDGQKGGCRLHDAGEHSAQKGAGLAHAFRPQGHGDNGPLREVLNRDAEGEGECAGGCETAVAAQPSRVDDADRHPLGDVVKRHGQDELGRPADAGPRPLLRAVQMHVGRDKIQNQEKEHPDQKTGGSGDEGQPAHMFRQFKRWVQKAPEGSGHHDACGKTSQDLADTGTHFSPQEKDTGRAQCCPGKGDQDAGRGVENS